MIRLFVGLGNPGAQYERTRHNAGFWMVNKLASAWGAVLAHDKAYNGLVARVQRNAQPVWLQQPLTFMNRSGQAVGPLARFFKIAPHEILVIHDELDISPGDAKMKLGGSYAGHNGLKDIASALGTLDFWRLRIGIGHPGVKDEVLNWVLQSPRHEDRQSIDDAIARSINAVPLMLEGDMVAATQVVHTTKPPRPKPPKPSSLPMPVGGAPIGRG